MEVTIEWSAETATFEVRTLVTARELHGEEERVALHMRPSEHGSYFDMHKRPSRSSPTSANMVNELT